MARDLHRWLVLIDLGTDGARLVNMHEELARHGLHVVTAADVAVLDAMAKAPEASLLAHQDLAVCRAELARRAVASDVLPRGPGSSE